MMQFTNMSLDDILKTGERGIGWILHPKFHNLYVRVSRRYIKNKKYDKVLDLANFEMEDWGKGHFTAFITELMNSCPYPIYVENVLNERLAKFLARIGFEIVDNSYPPYSFFYERGIIDDGKSSTSTDDRRGTDNS